MQIGLAPYGGAGAAPGAATAPIQSMTALPEQPLSRTCGITSTCEWVVSAAGRPDRLAQRAHRGQHGRGLVAAVRHAVGAAGVLAPPVGVPVGGLDEFLVRLHVPVVHQVAGLLPAEQRVGGDAPRGAPEVGLALEE